MICRIVCVLYALSLLNTHLASANQIAIGVIVPGGEDFGKQGTASDQASRGAREGSIPSQFNTCSLDITHPESESPEAYTDLVAKVASQSDFILDIGYNAQKATHKAADDHPDKNFAIIDFEFLPPVSNIASIMFRDDQEGFLAGLLAGELANNGVKKVVVIGGVMQPDQSRKVNGFVNGVKISCSDCTTYCHYSKSFSDNDKESDEIVKAILGIGGVDVVYSTASTTGTKALKRLVAESGIDVIGSGTDEWVTNWGIGSVPGSEHVITSTVRDYKNVVRQVVQTVLNGTFTVGQTIKYGVTGDPQTTSIKLADSHEAGGKFTPELKAKMNDYMTKMASGELDTKVDWKKGDNKEQTKCKSLLNNSKNVSSENAGGPRQAHSDATRMDVSRGVMAYAGALIAFEAARWMTSGMVWAL